MKKETIKTAPTVEAAVKAACEELGAAPEDVIYEVLAQPKRGFFGIGSADAKGSDIYAGSINIYNCA